MTDNTGDWIAVATVEEFTGRVLRASVRGRLLALFRLDDGIYALEDECSHERTAISGGPVWGGTIECPRHGARFDIKTGKNLSLPAVKPVASFPVKVEDGSIYVRIPG